MNIGEISENESAGMFDIPISVPMLIRIPKDVFEDCRAPDMNISTFKERLKDRIEAEVLAKITEEDWASLRMTIRKYLPPNDGSLRIEPAG